MNQQGLATIFSVLSVAAVFGPTAGAWAQDTVAVQRPIRVSIGSLGGKKGGINNPVSLGVSYDFSKTQQARPTLYSGYVDFASKSSSGRRLTITGVGVSGRYLLAAPGELSSGTPYATLGIGYYQTKLSGSDAPFTSDGFGGKLGLGYELTNGILGELEFVRAPSFNGFQYRIGYRF
jgi:hypothetical protein